MSITNVDYFIFNVDNTKFLTGPTGISILLTYNVELRDYWK